MSNHPPMITMHDKEVWEPWQPQVGDRVRVRLSGECDVQQFIVQTGEILSQHVPETDGAIGTIIKPLSGMIGGNGHDYVVKFDTPIFCASIDRNLSGAMMAAIELEPVDDQEEA